VQVLSEEVNRISGELSERPDPAYWVNVAAYDVERLRLVAANGVTITPERSHTREADVDVRVGSPALDHTHKIRDAGWFEDEPKDTFFLPVDGDERATRLAIWRATDDAYRQAQKRLLKVRANLAVKVASEDASPDFSSAPMAQDSRPAVGLDLSVTEWRSRLARVSALSLAHADVHESNISLDAVASTRVIVNSEGTHLVLPRAVYVLNLSVNTTAEDGAALQVYESILASTPEELPTEAALSTVFTDMVERLAALRDAPVAEPTTAPAILRGRAAAVFFHEVLGHRIESHRQRDDDEGQTFKDMVGESILPAFMNVTDDPTMMSREGIRLHGHYSYDDEGVAAQRVEVVKDGVLRNFLTSRTPIEGFPSSNGHGRRQPGYMVVSRQGNLLIEATKTVSEDTLRRKLLAQIRSQGKPYGFIIDDITGGFTFTGRSTPNAFVVKPVGIVRVWADGRPDELIRGADLIGTPLVAFSQVLAASNTVSVFNGYCGAESGYVPVSASAPDLLLGELEIQRGDKAHDRPPLLPTPGFEQ